MTLVDREALMLSRARAGLGPTAPERANVLDRLSAGLTLASVNPGSPPLSQSVSAGAGGAGGFSLQTLVAGVLVGSLAGFGAGVAVTSSRAPDLAVARHSAAPHPSGSPRVTAHQVPQLLPPPPRAPAPAPTDPSPAPRATSMGPAATASGAPPSASAEPTFYEELSYVRRAQSALKAGDARLALGLMQSLDEIQPRGALFAERNVTRVLALCQLGLAEEATRVARQTLGADPTSRVYQQRLRASCAAPALSQQSESQESERQQKPVKPVGE